MNIRRLLCLLVIFFTFCISVRATDIQVQQESISNWQNKTTTLFLRIFNDPFTDNNGVFHPGGPNAYYDIPVMVNTTTKTLTIPAFTVVATTNALDNQQARYHASFVDNRGRLVQVYDGLDNFFVPDVIASISNCSPQGVCATWADLRLFNNAQIPFLDRYSYSDRIIDLKIAQNNVSGLTAIPFITKTPQANLSNEFALSTLGNGILKNQTGTGNISIATGGVDFELPITFNSNFVRGGNNISLNQNSNIIFNKGTFNETIGIGTFADINELVNMHITNTNPTMLNAFDSRIEFPIAPASFLHSNFQVDFGGGIAPSFAQIFHASINYNMTGTLPAATVYSGSVVSNSSSPISIVRGEQILVNNANSGSMPDVILSKLSAVNSAVGSLGVVKGISLSDWANSGGVWTESYGIYADSSIDRGSSKSYFIHSTSLSPSLFSGRIDLKEITSIPNPTANHISLYAKDKAGVSHFYFKKDDGTEVEIGSGGGGGVTSIFGRGGIVTAQAGDYTAAQVTNAAGTNVNNNFTLGQSFSGGAIGTFFQASSLFFISDDSARVQSGSIGLDSGSVIGFSSGNSSGGPYDNLLLSGSGIQTKAGTALDGFSITPLGNLNSTTGIQYGVHIRDFIQNVGSGDSKFIPFAITADMQGVAASRTSTAFQVNMTNSASITGDSLRLIDLQLAGVTKFSINQSSQTFVGGPLPTGQTSTNSGVFLNSSNSKFYLHTTGTNTPEFLGWNFEGSTTAPAATFGNRRIFRLTGNGYDGTNFVLRAADISMFSGSTWTSTNRETFIRFSTTPNGSTTLTDRMFIMSNGNILINTPTDNTVDKLQVNGSISGTWNGAIIGPTLLGTGTRDGSKFLRDDGVWSAPPGGGGAVWGSISGTLSNQSDLQTTLDGKQTLDSDLTGLAGLSSTGFVKRTGAGTFTAANLVFGDIPDLSGTYQPLNTNLTSISALTDPNVDRLLFWDDSAGVWAHLTLGTNLSITGTTINVVGGGSPGGADTQLQFNDGGAFGGDSELTWNKTTNALTLSSNTENMLTTTSTGSSARISVNSVAGTPNSGIELLENNSPKWTIASFGGGTFTFYNESLAVEAMNINSLNNNVTLGGGLSVTNNLTAGSNFSWDNTASTFLINGIFRTNSFWTALATKTANFTVTTNDKVLLLSASSGTPVASLPAASSCFVSSRTIEFDLKNIGTVAWTIDPNASENIEGSTTITLDPGNSVRIITDGTSWWIL